MAIPQILSVFGVSPAALQEKAALNLQRKQLRKDAVIRRNLKTLSDSTNLVAEHLDNKIQLATRLIQSSKCPDRAKYLEAKAKYLKDYKGLINLLNEKEREIKETAQHLQGLGRYNEFTEIEQCCNKLQRRMSHLSRLHAIVCFYNPTAELPSWTSSLRKRVRAALDAPVVKSGHTFAQDLFKGKPYAIVITLVGLSALKYIATQKTLLGSAFALTQISLFGALFYGQAATLAAICLTAYGILKVYNWSKPNPMNQLARAQALLTQATQQISQERAVPTIQRATHAAVGTAGMELGNRIQYQGEGRVAAGLERMNLTPAAQQSAALALRGLPILGGCYAAYLTSRHYCRAGAGRALAVTGGLGIVATAMQAVREQSDDTRVLEVQRQRAVVIDDENSTPGQEVLTGVALSTAGSVLNLSSGSLLANSIGIIPAALARVATHFFPSSL